MLNGYSPSIQNNFSQNEVVLAPDGSFGSQLAPASNYGSRLTDL